MSRVYKEVCERKKSIPVSNEVCYGCYMSISTDHNSRSCKKRRVWDTCGEKHLTGLHGYKGSKKNKYEDAGNSQRSDSTLACATAKIKSKIPSNN